MMYIVLTCMCCYVPFVFYVCQVNTSFTYLYVVVYVCQVNTLFTYLYVVLPTSWSINLVYSITMYHKYGIMGVDWRCQIEVYIYILNVYEVDQLYICATWILLQTRLLAMGIYCIQDLLLWMICNSRVGIFPDWFITEREMYSWYRYTFVNKE